MAYPSYIEAFNTGVLRQKASEAQRLLENCRICPRRCGVNRLKDEKGFCKTGRNAIICSFFPHHGEEPPISGTKGSGTIFFSRCNMTCLYCQNYSFSQMEEGSEAEAEEIADIMLKLQSEGCHNINFVTPTHIMPQILEALLLAAGKGLTIPLVYNTSGFECPDIISFLKGIIDIYLADMRYADKSFSKKYSNAEDYPEFNMMSVKEMFGQVGEAQFSEEGVMTRGLIVRHLVLPENISSTEKTFRFIAEELSRKTTISLMSQYFPAFKAAENPPLNRSITQQEYQAAVNLLQTFGLENGWIQESDGQSRFAGTNIKRNI